MDCFLSPKLTVLEAFPTLDLPCRWNCPASNLIWFLVVALAVIVGSRLSVSRLAPLGSELCIIVLSKLLILWLFASTNGNLLEFRDFAFSGASLVSGFAFVAFFAAIVGEIKWLRLLGVFTYCWA